MATYTDGPFQFYVESSGLLYAGDPSINLINNLPFITMFLTARVIRYLEHDLVISKTEIYI